MPELASLVLRVESWVKEMMVLGNILDRDTAIAGLMEIFRRS